MKKAISLLIIICILSLSGCGGMRNQLRQLEQLLVVQTLGFDTKDDDVRLTLASAAGSGKSAAYLSNSGQTVALALERIRLYSFEEELFCAHVSNILIGEEAASEGIKDLLSYICHSPELRIDLPVYVIKGASANEVMCGIGNGEKGITEVLAALRSSLEYRGTSNIFTVAEIQGSIERNGCALVCALEYAQASEMPENQENEPLSTLASYGYAVLKDNSPVQFIDSEDAVGVSFLLNKVGVSDISLKDLDGNTVTLEIDNGSCEVFPIWESNTLSGIDIRVKAEASFLEAEGNNIDLSSAEYVNQLVAGLETELSERIGSVLSLSKRMRADFLNLAAIVEYSDPARFRASVEDMSSLLPKLELRVSVQGQLSHTNNLKDA